MDRLVKAVTLKLDDDDRSMMDSLLTSAEYRTAIDALHSNKSFECDGLQVEFYRQFWLDIWKDVELVYQEALE